MSEQLALAQAAVLMVLSGEKKKKGYTVYATRHGRGAGEADQKRERAGGNCYINQSIIVVSLSKILTEPYAGKEKPIPALPQ